MRLLRLAIVLACGLVMTSISASAQTSRCRGPDTWSADLLENLQAWIPTTDSTDSIIRRDWHVPKVSSGQISLVTTDSICAAAGDVYDSVLLSSAQTANHRVYVFKVDTVYIVVDPDSRGSANWNLYLTLDASFTIIAKMAS